MNDRIKWLKDLGKPELDRTVDGLVLVNDFVHGNHEPEVVAMMEKAKEDYGAYAVFFEAARNGKPPVAQAFVYVSDGPANDPQFGELHKRLWSWGGVPLVYRKTLGLVQLFRCAHDSDFVDPKTRVTICNPIKTLTTAVTIDGLFRDQLRSPDDDPTWDASQLRSGTLWDDPKVCNELLSAKSAHKRLVDAVKDLYKANILASLKEENVLEEHLRRKLLILSLLIAYLEARGVLDKDFFGEYRAGAKEFFEVLAHGEALVTMLVKLEERFNGNVFTLNKADQEILKGNSALARFANFVEGLTEKGGQRTLWELYSFKDLPVEVISNIYQLFVTDPDSSVYTPPFLVRLMLDEALDWKRLDRLEEKKEIILDPSCGSGVFLVEAYKRLVLHWRSKNGWKRPGVKVLKELLQKVHGIDLEPGAVELTAFSLCLALCDALKPEVIRKSIKLFPRLAGKTLHHSCFFDAKDSHLVQQPVGVVVGNPPFKSSLDTPGARRSYERYVATVGDLPDKQLAYLFLHESMGMISEGGVLCMLQQYNFLYNQHSHGFRGSFIGKWDVREILDFISVRGLFQKGSADTKVVAVLAEAAPPRDDRDILHATFRRSGRADAEQGFDIDYYDLHRLPRKLALANDGVWRADLLGGGRVLWFVDRLKKFRTLSVYAKEQGWDFGEGFIEGQKGNLSIADHITGKSVLPSVALTEAGLDRAMITTVKARLFKSAYTKERFTAPMLLIREHMDIPNYLWTETYLTYTQQIVGLCSREEDIAKLREVSAWLSSSRRVLKAYVALTSPRLFAQKATALQADDIYSIPYPEPLTFDFSATEQILVDDVVDYYRDLIRLGEKSKAMKKSGWDALANFSDVFTRQINAIYQKNPLRALEAQKWPGVICQPFAFGEGEVDWTGADELKGKVQKLLKEQKGQTLNVTRIVRMYDDRYIFLLKPDRLRYWLQSVALRDADETLADLWAQETDVLAQVSEVKSHAGR